MNEGATNSPPQEDIAEFTKEEVLGSTKPAFIQECLERNPNLFLEICSGYLRVMIARKMPNANNIEDAVQDSLIKITRGLNKWEGGDSKFISWITTIGDNTAIDYDRKMDRILRHNKEYYNGLKLQDDKLSQLENILDDNLDRKTLDSAKAKLFEGHRDLIERRHYRHQSIEEMATELGLPHRTVIDRLGRARSRLRQIFKKERETREPGQNDEG